MRRTLQEIQSDVPPCVYQVDVPIRRTMCSISDYNIDLDPVFQREHVWTRSQQEDYVGALIQNPRSMGPIIINDCGQRILERCEVVDGKQRLTAICKWCDLQIVANTPAGDQVWFDSLDEIEKRMVGMTITLQWRWVRLSRKQVMEYYLRLNAGGTVHTQEELSRVRNLISELGDKNENT